MAVNQPDLNLQFPRSSKVQKVTKEDSKFLNTAIKSLCKAPTTIRFVKIDPLAARIFIMSDASFRTNADLTSQMGVMVVTVEQYKRCNILHFSLKKFAKGNAQRPES